MRKRFVEAKSFGLHISKPKHVLGNTFFDVSKMSTMAMYHGNVSWLFIMAMYHGYAPWLCTMAMYHGYVSWLCIMARYHGYVFWLCILNQKVVPQGLLGKICHKLRIQGRMHIFEIKVLECFKSRFDIVERKISTRFFDPAKKY